MLADIEIITSYLGTRWFNKLEAFSNCPFLYMIVPSLGGSSEGMKCVHTINYQNQKSVQCHSSKGHLISEQICEDIDFPKSQRKYC